MSTFTECCAATAAYRAANPNKPKGVHITKQQLQPFANKEGIRIYFGIENGQAVFAIVATDVNGNDIDITSNIVKNQRPCPDWCSTPNALNS